MCELKASVWRNFQFGASAQTDDRTVLAVAQRRRDGRLSHVPRQWKHLFILWRREGEVGEEVVVGESARPRRTRRHPPGVFIVSQQPCPRGMRWLRAYDRPPVRSALVRDFDRLVFTARRRPTPYSCLDELIRTCRLSG
jgi:hypothetical protein